MALFCGRFLGMPGVLARRNGCYSRKVRKIPKEKIFV
jgi:hypothetical protein